MSLERLFLDTAFIQALLNRRDQYHTSNMHVVSVDTPLLMRALRLYRERPDKIWGLTDCISFIVMQEQKLTDAVTTDGHFVQAGYCALMLEAE